MTGQDGGFRAATARFKAEVEAALTRARRAAAEAREQSADFRRGTDDLADQARTGRLRLRRTQVRPTSAEAKAEAEKFRNANDLPVEDLPDADELTARPAEQVRPQQHEDEDFSQHQVLYDIDKQDEPAAAKPAVDQTSDESARTGIDSPVTPAMRSGGETEDFSQQRILFDVTVESYRPDPLPDSVFEPSDDKKPS
ncbi:MAG TPA: hypothetical protein VH969_25400 [Actinophytocola sp.]|jgi:hypothetical protein|uniref:hypothetical protein n=1 Tax=Actinophytocola sp. TaxID=1872138 RepID=UPI002F92EA8C